MVSGSRPMPVNSEGGGGGSVRTDRGPADPTQGRAACTVLDKARHDRDDHEHGDADVV